MLALANIGASAQSFVEDNGWLQVKGKQLCNQQGKPVQLRGFSMFGIMYYPECITYEGFKSIRDFWGGNVVRATVVVSDKSNNRNYNDAPDFNKAMVDSMVRWTEQLGMYCLIDWHVLHPGNPSAREYAGAKAFFREMSRKYRRKQHVMYELCNEPHGDTVTWDSIVAYANPIIRAIRKRSHRSIIIVGTPGWSQQLNAVNTKLVQKPRNVMYAFHFYAATHQDLLPMFMKEIHRIPVFVTEWGPCANTGNGFPDYKVCDKYLNTMKQHAINGDTVSISWCNFSFADKRETASCLQPHSCTLKRWDEASPTGRYVLPWMKSNTSPYDNRQKKR